MTRTGRRFSILFAAIAALAKTGSAAARREFLPSARVLAAVACLALFGALALPGAAQAQTVTTLVSNTGQLASSFSANAIGAQPFTTGSAAVLTSVDVYLGGNGRWGVEDIRVRILQDDSGSPGTELVTLPYLTAKIDHAFNTFTAPADTNLAAGTTYFVEVSKNGDFGVYWGATESHLEDDGGATGWEISDTLYYKNSAGDPLLVHFLHRRNGNRHQGHDGGRHADAVHGRYADRSGRQRRQFGPDAYADLRIGHRDLHGVGGEYRRRGDGDAVAGRFRRVDRISGTGTTRRSTTRTRRSDLPPIGVPQIMRH